MNEKLKLKYEIKSINDLNQDKETLLKQNLKLKMFRDMNFTNYEISSKKNFMLNNIMMNHIVIIINKNAKINLPTDLDFNAFNNPTFAKIYDALSKTVITNDITYLDILKDYLDNNQLAKIEKLLKYV